MTVVRRYLKSPPAQDVAAHTSDVGHVRRCVVRRVRWAARPVAPPRGEGAADQDDGRRPAGSKWRLSPRARHLGLLCRRRVDASADYAERFVPFWVRMRAAWSGLARLPRLRVPRGATLRTTRVVGAPRRCPPAAGHLLARSPASCHERAGTYAGHEWYWWTAACRFPRAIRARFTGTVITKATTSEKASER